MLLLLLQTHISKGRTTRTLHLASQVIGKVARRREPPLEPGRGKERAELGATSPAAVASGAGSSHDLSEWGLEPRWAVLPFIFQRLFLTCRVKFVCISFRRENRSSAVSSATYLSALAAGGP